MIEVHTGTRRLSAEQTQLLLQELQTRWERQMPSLVITGGARGADTLVHDLACKWEIPTEIFLPHYTSTNGHYAPLERNTRMINRGVELGAMVVAWKPHSSNGTQDTINKALAAGLAVDEWDGQKWLQQGTEQLSLELF